MEKSSTLTFSLATVVSPTDNEDSFRMMLNSLLRQSENLDEYYFVINGSVSKKLLCLCQEFKSRVNAKVLFHYNYDVRSLSECLNFIIDNSKCTILVRLDPDDYALPNRFSNLKSTFLVHAPDIYFTNSIFYDGSKMWLDKRVYFNNVTQALVKLFFYNPIVHSTAAFNREIIKKCGGYPEIKFVEDYSLWLTLKNQSLNFYFDSTLSVIYNCKNVLSRRSSLDLFKSEFLLFKKNCINGQFNYLKIFFIYILRLFYLFAPIFIKWIFSKVNRLKIKNQSLYFNYLDYISLGPIMKMGLI